MGELIMSYYGPCSQLLITLAYHIYLANSCNKILIPSKESNVGPLASELTFVTTRPMDNFMKIVKL